MIAISRRLLGSILGTQLSVIMLCGCEELVIRDTSSLLAPRFQRSEIIGVVAGFGTTFAAVPDLVAMLRRRSSKGMNPTMAGIMGVFQIAWLYYGLLIASRPVIAWNMVAMVINFLSVGAYLRFARNETKQAMRSASTILRQPRAEFSEQPTSYGPPWPGARAG